MKMANRPAAAERVMAAKPRADSQWRRFFMLMGIFFVASGFAWLIPTPGSWSDIRSQWFGTAWVAVLCIVFIIVSVRSFRRSGSLTGVQATLLCLIFGLIFVFAARELFVSAQFLQEVRRNNSSLGARKPNKWTAPNPL